MANTDLARQNGAAALERVLIEGDLANLSPEQRITYYQQVCESVGLNPLTKPFDYLRLNNKTVLYAKRDATDQLRKIHGVSVTGLERERMEDVYVVTAHVQDRPGRTDSSIGAVAIANLKGEALANALMKAETKAKRRATLSICGLGILDETEVSTIPGAVVERPEDAEGVTFGKRAPDEPEPPALEAELPLDDPQWQAEVRSAPAAVTGSGVTEAQLRTIEAHVKRTGATLAKDAASLTRDEASALIRDLSKRPNHA